MLRLMVEEGVGKFGVVTNTEAAEGNGDRKSGYEAP